MTTQERIDIINDGLAWLRTNKPEVYEHSLFPMLDGRRRLRRHLAALDENPAIGAFGESQTGKSYLTNTLLNRRDKPFLIYSSDHPEGVGFVDRINPIGDKREATGVVTRMTSFANHPERYNYDYPVIVKLLDLGQLATILSSGYYANIRDFGSYSEEELRAIAELLRQRYGNRPELPEPPMIEDDILDIKDYLTTYHKASTQFLMREDYFETLTRIIRRVPAAELPAVLQYLWHGNEVLTSLFGRLAKVVERFGFAKEVYVPIEAVIHHSNNRNTIMSVMCLNGLDQDNWDVKTDVYVPQPDGRLRREADVLSCELCALSAEVIFKIEEEYLDESTSYFYDDAHAGEPGYLPRASRAKLADTVDKNLLRNTDFLDFPGARSPDQQDERNCNSSIRDDENDNQSVLIRVYLRGKVAYLFNYYSESHLMKVLLFCHHDEQSEVKNLHMLIEAWVKHNVGATVADRALTLRRTGGISPLFVVATKMNIDMTRKSHESHNNDTALNTRWEGRFRTVFLNSVLNSAYVDWFRNWSAPGESFKDTYLLRSYEYCACSSSGNQMFDGYDVTTSSPEKRLMYDGDYFRRLRSTFVANPSVRELFFDPELAWDVVSTLNNDGSLYIIERLSKVAGVAADIRREQIEREGNDIMATVRTILSHEYDTDNDNEKLLQNIQTANDIRWEFDASCGTDSFFFGHLIQALQVTEAECLNIVHGIVHNTVINDDINNPDGVDMILRRVKHFEGCRTDDERWERLLKSYGWRTKEVAYQKLADKGIVDVEALFSPPKKAQTNQDYIAEHLMALWRSKVNSETLINTFTSNTHGFSPVVMKELIGQLIDSAERLNLPELIAERIRPEVNVANVSQVKESLVADIVASTLNDFVNDFGYSMLTDEMRDKARSLAEDNYLSVYEYIGRERPSTFGHDELADMFEETFERGGAITESFDNRYNEWLEYMTIAFIVHLRRSELPPEVNAALGEIINKISVS